MSAKKDQTGNTENQGFPGFDPASVDAYLVKDPHTLAMNIARAAENFGKAATEWLGPRERGELVDTLDPLTDLIKTLSKVAEYWMAEPQRTLEAQTLLLSSYMAIWSRSVARFSGEPVPPEPEMPKDKRFSDEDWAKNPFFAVLRQAYVVTVAWAEQLVKQAQDLDEHTRHKAEFYLRQVTAALSPSNFALTNPEVFRETVASSGINLVQGMRMLAEDIAKGGGELRLRQTDESRFELGRDLAITPGKVVARSEICEIIQYAPTTENVFKRPLLIIPPWINKFYILDLTPQKSFVRWCVEQGHTVFMVSWVNPDERHAAMGWGSYINDGVDFALKTVYAASGERNINAIGYCVGGTLLATALARRNEKPKSRQPRVVSATFLAAQVDFTHAGDLKVFVDEEQLAILEKHMTDVGYLAGSKMATAFNMLRASELIWPYVVSNYLKGRDPLPFDLLHWNADSTRMTPANHAYYLRNCYLDNALSLGKMELAGQPISLSDIKIPVYSLATRDDHIAPAKSVFKGSMLFGGPTEFVLAASGHIAGVVNPPERKKYQYWSGAPLSGTLDDWIGAAYPEEGSWWPHWQAWITAQDDTQVPARQPGDGKLKPLGDAPGTYVLVRS
ncbi:class I poly(R)-hydroxyalkanoic acid synthase [Rhizobiales bacterium RZME27]|uniref:Class I poly(R)-hydroxyalkanoic acid synthase n=1 Tax=Endobacterium cereale TaxID=2663029 RepID=A0A6A8ADH0_9HYPH|nr:class I poly(R)-hydroxyalkanoic acid synthase [Endobacterium cereale]MEB2843711.1 class I poly(R)-hydroxyalkanoic acid synthase [Endobacterium cereale]MQY49363.1 class I poly(R)-hydroxyalkanoic acid synthase [Endobacterium cereale]